MTIYVYFLIDKRHSGGVVYVGQANERMNGEGIWLRVSEHDKLSEDYWTEAIMIVHKTDGLGATELNFLENKFCNLAITAGNDTRNKKNPTIGSYGDAVEVVMEPFIDEVLSALRMIGYHIFEKAEISEQVKADDGILLYIKRNAEGRKVDARCLYKDDEYTLLKGSQIALAPTPTCLQATLDRRKNESDKVDASGILLSDMTFHSPSAASQFALYSTSNGKVDMKDVDGVTLKEILGEV